jgi:intein/homing endonuclease
MYGNKNLPERLDVIGPKGQIIPNLKINLEYYLTEEQFTEFYNQKLTYKEISKLIGFPYDTSVFSRSVRSVGWKKSIGKTSKYSVDETFFKTWNKKNAWVYGWLITDGHVNEKSVELTLQSQDEDVLVKLKDLLNFTGGFYDRSTHKTLRVYNRNLINSLYALGLPEKDKTFTCRFPNIPNEFKWAFIRGAFEGDGSISVSKGKDLKVSICGASQDLMIGIQEFLAINGVNTRADRSGNSFIHLHATSLSDSLRWLYLMYNGTNVVGNDNVW